MNCKQVRELLPLYADGDMDEDELEAISTHLRGCEECSSRLELDRALGASLSTLPQPAAARIMAPRVQQRVMADLERRQRSQAAWKTGRRVVHFTGLALEVALVLVLIGTVSLIGKSLIDRSRASQPTVVAVVTTPTPSAVQPTKEAPAVPTAGRTQEPATVLTPTEQTQFSVYFMRGDKIGTAHRTVPKTQAVGAAAVNALLAGPNAQEQDAGLVSNIPTGTQLLGLSIDNKVATVNLSAGFESGGGSLSMSGRLAQVVYTLTQFPTVDSVQFQLDGKAVSTFGGEGIVLDHPVTRADYEQLTPAIFAESPAVGDVITSPVRIWGTANTFEAAFVVQIVDQNGNVLVEQNAQATSGTGTRGTFDVSVLFTANKDGPGKVVLFERSAKDGSPINVVEIPVTLSLGNAAPTPAVVPTPSDTPPATSSPNLSSFRMVDATTGWGLDHRLGVLRTTDGGAHWSIVQMPIPGPESIGSTYFMDANNAWVQIGVDKGTPVLMVLRTRDGGQTWEPGNNFSVMVQGSGMGGWLTFIDAQHGWLMINLGAAAGSQGVAIFSTTDGGMNWKQMSVTDPTQAQQAGALPFGCNKSGVTFIDQSTGWVTGSCAGGDPFFYATHDAGKTWQRQALPAPSDAPDAFTSGGGADIQPPFFSSAKDGVLKANVYATNGMISVLYITHDGGKTWVAAKAPAPEILGSPVIVGNSTVWLVGWQPVNGTATIELYVSHDGGQTWEGSLTSEKLASPILSFAGEQTGWAAGAGSDNASLFQTEDGGATWTEISPRVGPAAQATQVPASNLRACDASDLTPTFFFQGATGSLAGGMTLNNHATPCQLIGIASARFVDANGQVVVSSTQAAGAGSSGPIVLDSGQKTALIPMTWRNWCGQQLNTPLSVVATLPGGHGELAVPMFLQDAPNPGMTPRCDVPDQPSTLTVEPFTWSSFVPGG